MASCFVFRGTIDAETQAITRLYERNFSCFKYFVLSIYGIEFHCNTLLVSCRNNLHYHTTLNMLFYKIMQSLSCHSENVETTLADGRLFHPSRSGDHRICDCAVCCHVFATMLRVQYKMNATIHGS
jgi:hypothetical protein